MMNTNEPNEDRPAKLWENSRRANSDSYPVPPGYLHPADEADMRDRAARYTAYTEPNSDHPYNKKHRTGEPVREVYWSEVVNREWLVDGNRYGYLPTRRDQVTTELFMEERQIYESSYKRDALSYGTHHEGYPPSTENSVFRDLTPCRKRCSLLSSIWENLWDKKSFHEIFAWVRLGRGVRRADNFVGSQFEGEYKRLIEAFPREYNKLKGIMCEALPNYPFLTEAR